MSSLGDCLVWRETALEDTDLGLALTALPGLASQQTVQGELVAANSHNAGKTEVARSLADPLNAVVDYGRITFSGTVFQRSLKDLRRRPAGFRAVCSNKGGRS